MFVGTANMLSRIVLVAGFMPRPLGTYLPRPSSVVELKQRSLNYSPLLSVAVV